MPLRSIRTFIKLESSAGIILFLAALLAIIIDNSPFAIYYENFFKIVVDFSIGSYLKLEKPLLLWINDGLMAIFFLLMGLEIKREMIEGELNSFSKAILPAIAAIGGMLAPAAIYYFINHQDPLTQRGWAIPTATDTAFSLGILALLGKRIPVGLKIFLTALAIFDDIGAIIIMAIFYSSHISQQLLICALGFLMILILLNILKVRRLGPYCVVGFLLWVCVLNSGIHATLAGIILALVIPYKTKPYTIHKKVKDPIRTLQSPLRLLEYKLHPWVAFGVLPLFAFANAGVSFSGFGWNHLFTPIPLGIALGLFFGKQIGIWGSTMLAMRCGVPPLGKEITPFGLYGLSLIAGVGFTMSLFIGTLAFHASPTYAALVRMGVIAGSLCAGFLGYWVLKFAYKV